MSAKFSKLQEVDLTLDDPAGDENGTTSGVDTESAGDEGTVELNLVEDPVFVPKWKFWNKPYGFRYDLASTKRHLSRRKARICKRCNCTINSWKAVIITLLVFMVAVLISVIISRVLTEPPGEPSQFEGIQIKTHIIFFLSQ